MKILLSWSSGKDSAWALHVLNQTHPGAVAALLTTLNEEVKHAWLEDFLKHLNDSGYGFVCQFVKENPHE